MAQRTVEMLIGRLITDEQFRGAFLARPAETLLDLCNRGVGLTDIEIAALLETDPTLWVRAAEGLDPRLHKASLSYQPASEKESAPHV